MSLIEETAFRPRISSDDRRRVMLEHAVTTAEAEGVGVTIGGLGFERLIADVGVPRSTVYRLWDSKQSFENDVLALLVARTASRLDQPSVDQGHRMIHDGLERSELDPNVLLADMIGVAVEQNLRSLSDSTAWRNFVCVALSARAIADDDARERIEKLLRAREDHALHNLSRYYEHVLELVGVRLRPEYAENYTALATALSAYVEGLALLRALSPRYTDTALSEDGRTVLSVGFEGIIRAFTEPF